MSKITIYLIRHSEQIQNEKIVLSINGENKAYKLSNNNQLQDID